MTRLLLALLAVGVGLCLSLPSWMLIWNAAENEERYLDGVLAMRNLPEFEKTVVIYNVQMLWNPEGGEPVATLSAYP